MEKISFPVMFFISFPEAMLLGLLGLLMLGFKPTPKQVFLVGFFQAMFSYLIRSFPLPFGIHTFLQFISFSLIIYLVMLIPYKTSFLAALVSLSIYACVEAVSIPLLLNLTGLSLQVVLNNIWVRLAFFLPEAVIIILIIFLAHRFNIKLFIKSNNVEDKNKAFKINKSFPLICLFFTQNIIIALFYLANYVGIYDRSIFQNFAPVIVIIAILPVVAIVMIKRVISLIQNEIENQIQLDSLRHVEELLQTIRGQRHNFSHNLQTVYGLLEVQAFEEAQEYIRGNMSEIAATSELIKTDNLGITALLQTKTGLAEAKKINLIIDINTSLRNLPLETRDANMILGNLIDNAMEAVDEMPPQQRNVEVILSQDIEGYVFDVRNCGPPIEPELIEQIFDYGFSTKNEGRGMGLYSVKNLAQKYNGKIHVTSDSSCTCFKVVVPYKS
ncbi:MAG: histidine kinase [Firmicutes bacterium HGW-Firmicutes-8]|nr:MAG: histidine kinase [Firmicutes bacterium HGW-Firmicutes-8]